MSLTGWENCIQVSFRLVDLEIIRILFNLMICVQKVEQNKEYIC